MKSDKNGLLDDRCDYCQRFELLDMITDALLLTHVSDGTVIFMNQQARELYGYSTEESKVLSIFSLSHTSQSTVVEQMKIAKQYAKGYSFITRHVKKDGMIIKVQVNMKYILFHGNKIFAIVIREATQEDKLREEFELAGNVQRRLLPPNMENQYASIRTLYHPRNYVSGDVYDFVFDEAEKLLYGTVMDVMGHGLAAASHTNILKYLFYQTLEKSMPVSEKLSWINSQMTSFFSDGNFAAVFLFEFDFKSKTLTYASGGIHRFTYVYENNVEIIKCPGLFLGIKSKETFEQNTISFQAGDSFFFLTDGFDQWNPQAAGQNINFNSMHETLKTYTATTPCKDDASGLCILTH